MHLGTWNVQGLRNKGEIIIKYLEKLKLDIIILREKKKRVVDWKWFVD
jgi:exonuclease III